VANEANGINGSSMTLVPYCIDDGNEDDDDCDCDYVAVSLSRGQFSREPFRSPSARFRGPSLVILLIVSQHEPPAVETRPRFVFRAI